MSDILSSPLYIQVEGAEYRAPVSESLIQSIGGSTNWLLDKVYQLLESANPIGTVIASTLTESQFQAIMTNGWVLCAGQSIVGSDLFNLTGQTTAIDLRGRYIRMKDHGAGITPDGDLAIGATISDQFGQHNHGYAQNPHSHLYNSASIFATAANAGRLATRTGFVATVSNDYDFVDVTQATTSDNAGISFSVSGGAETRPKSLILNYFIRVNKTYL